MSEDSRRRIAAIVALVGGLYLAVSLLPVHLSGGFGDWLASWLWRLLGLGAVCFPLLGLGLFLTGLDWLPHLNMKRVAILMSGLGVIIPYLVGVIIDFRPGSYEAGGLAPRLAGVLPGMLAYYVQGAVGLAGGLLLGFLSLSALTILTIAWHPLQALERGEKDAAMAPGRVAAGQRRTVGPPSVPAPPPDEVESEDLFPPPRLREKKSRKAPASKSAGPAALGDPEDDNVAPPIDLLALPPRQDTDAGEAELDRLGQVLLETLRTFKIEGSIAGRTTGPVVTQFEVVPGPGVKVGRIASLADDMAITMRAQSIRVAPIPGKGAVGVEIPNPTARMVTLRELLESPEWENSRSVLPIALGRDLEGRPIIADLAKMPHLLIAGATGSGKSVAVNTIITALIYRYSPRQLRFLMVDPKMVELSMYNALPHLRHSVVTNNHDAALALGWAVEEMGRRYALLHANGARNLADFNRKAAEGKPLKHPSRPKPTLASIAEEPPDTPPEPPQDEEYRDGPLPFIVMIIDELADLMMTVQGEVETPLALLAQKARAIGIHLILATQRPSVNVITGLIKANFPSRIAFRVASKVDSRTIIDQNGAEALLGNGDMLFLPPGKSEPLRLQGAFIATEETEQVTGWFRRRQEARTVAGQATGAIEPDIIELMRLKAAEGDEKGAGMVEGDRDSLFREAAEICIQNQGGSTSLLQRRLSIGYGRAARIIDQLYQAGILGPTLPGSSRPREVLIGLEQLDEYAG